MSLLSKMKFAREIIYCDMCKCDWENPPNAAVNKMIIKGKIKNVCTDCLHKYQPKAIPIEFE